jgi:predicted O-methyltransferase YrrM
MKHWSEIQGWFDYGDVFNFLLTKVPDGGIFLECGAWLGASSSYLCDQAEDRIKVFIVDSWKGSSDELDTHQILATQTDIYPLFLENMGNRKFTPIRKTSVEASKDFKDESCDVIYIDMEHTYEAVIEDLHHWYPKLKKGGYIAGHDAYHPGVSRAIKEFFNNKFSVIGNCECCWLVRKEII